MVLFLAISSFPGFGSPASVPFLEGRVFDDSAARGTTTSGAVRSATGFVLFGDLDCVRAT
jgi:hypothetical protein